MNPNSKMLLKRWALGLGGVVLLLGMLPWALQPWLKGQVAAQLAQMLGRAVHIESLDLSLLRARVGVQGLVVVGQGDKTGQAPLFTLTSAEAALAPSSLWRRMLVLRELTLNSPQLTLSREADGRTSLDDVLARLKARPASSGEPLAWALYNLRVTDGRVQLEQANGPRWVLDQLALGLPFVSSHRDDVDVHVQPKLSGRWQGREFSAQVQSRPFLTQPEASMTLDWQGFELAQLDPWLPRSLGLHLTAGQTDGSLRLNFKAPRQAAPQLSLSGRVKVHGLDLNLAQGPLRAVQGGAVELELLPSEPLRQQFHLQSLKASAAKLELQPGTPRGLQAHDVQAAIGGLQWPLTPQAAPWSVQLRWADQVGRALAQTQAQGSVSAAQAHVDWQLMALDLQAAQVWQGFGKPWQLAGEVAAKGSLSLDQPLQPDPQARVKFSVEQLAAQRLQLQHGDDLRWQNGELQVTGLHGSSQRELKLKSVSLKGGALRLHREARGLWAAVASEKGGASSAGPGPAVRTDPWRLSLDEFNLALAQIEWVDGMARPLQEAGQAPRQTSWQGQELTVQAGPLRWDGQTLASTALKLGLRSGPRQNPALLNWRGRVSSRGGVDSPWAEGRLSLRRWPLAVADGYLPAHLGLGLRDALLGAELDLRADQQAVQLNGAADLQSLDLVSTREDESLRWVDQRLLAWQRLGALGLDVRWPLQPGERPRLRAEDVALQGLQAQLLIDAQGQLRLRGRAESAEGVAASAPAAAASAPESASPLPLIQVGRIRLENAAVDFEDRFVKPSYRAQLGRLSGELGRFDSEQPQRAPLRLSGSVAGTGVLTVEGEMHPALRPPQLDLRVQASDIELAPLTSYSGKYLGYAIERGKLSSQLHYRLGPEGRLQADNRVVLNQLTLGERVESPEATTLPVRLALALLSDRDGVIDINLPIEGSLQDPQFRIGAVVWKLIGNLIVKVVSSPFAWMSGGGDQGEAGRLAFAPGSARFESGAALAQLAKVAEALKQRPTLQLTLSAGYDLAQETPALARERVEAALRQAWARERGQADQAGGLNLPEAERSRLLRALYTSRPLPDRPRNLLGLLKTVPDAEMLTRLQAAEKVGEAEVRDLALARAAAVRDALVAQGLPLQRLFLAAPKPMVASEPGWQPRVELGLSLP